MVWRESFSKPRRLYTYPYIRPHQKTPDPKHIITPLSAWANSESRQETLLHYHIFTSHSFVPWGGVIISAANKPYRRFFWDHTKDAIILDVESIIACNYRMPFIPHFASAYDYLVCDTQVLELYVEFYWPWLIEINLKKCLSSLAFEKLCGTEGAAFVYRRPDTTQEQDSSWGVPVPTQDERVEMFAKFFRAQAQINPSRSVPKVTIVDAWKK